MIEIVAAAAADNTTTDPSVLASFLGVQRTAAAASFKNAILCSLCSESPKQQIERYRKVLMNLRKTRTQNGTRLRTSSSSVSAELRIARRR